MSEINDGGPAYPARPREIMGGGEITAANEGMSLLDAAALAALPQMIAGYVDGLLRPLEGEATGHAIVRGSFDLAEAFIAERAKRREK